MFKRALCAAGVAGALLLAAPSAAFASTPMNEGGCGRHGWHHHHGFHHHHHHHHHHHNWTCGPNGGGGDGGGGNGAV